MNQFRIILLINVVAILLLHALVPHRHHEEMTYIEHNKAHENANDIIDYLGLTFHQTTNSSLENFIFSQAEFFKNLDSKNISFLNSFGSTGILNSQIQSGFKSFKQNSLLEFTILANGLRAPPNYGFYI